MYFPFLRGKRFELLALAQLSPVLTGGSRVIPTIEPVRGTTQEMGLLRKLMGLGFPLVLIENPSHGDFKENHEKVQGLLRESSDRPHLVAGYLINAKTSLKEIQAFLRRNKERPVAFYHMGNAARPERINELQKKASVAYNVFLSVRRGSGCSHIFTSGNAVILDHAFTLRERNEDYPAHEFYSDRHKTYTHEGFFGFGDFLIVGNQFKEKGGAPLAVAIHLTNLEGANEVWIRHFISDRTIGRGVDTAGKFLEALDKMARFIQSRENWLMTEGCKEFLELHSRQHYPGLGEVKRISMKHHIELMNAILQ